MVDAADLHPFWLSVESTTENTIEIGSWRLVGRLDVNDVVMASECPENEARWVSHYDRSHDLRHRGEDVSTPVGEAGDGR